MSSWYEKMRSLSETVTEDEANPIDSPQLNETVVGILPQELRWIVRAATVLAREVMMTEIQRKRIHDQPLLTTRNELSALRQKLDKLCQDGDALNALLQAEMRNALSANYEILEIRHDWTIVSIDIPEDVEKLSTLVEALHYARGCSADLVSN